MIKFEQTGRRPDGEKIYRLMIDDRVIREGMTLDEVIAEIHRADGEDHSVRRDQGIPPYGGDRRPAADRRRMARREPSQARSASHECPRVAMGSADE